MPSSSLPAEPSVEPASAGVDQPLAGPVSSVRTVGGAHIVIGDDEVTVTVAAGCTGIRFASAVLSYFPQSGILAEDVTIRVRSVPR